MEKRPRALLLKFPGTNCDEETQRGLQLVGVDAEILPSAALTPGLLEEAQLVVFSGGFSYGDYIMAGRLAQLELEHRLADALHKFVDRGGYVLGICNGFQILTKIGLLPEGSLVHNKTGRYMCQWVKLEKTSTESPYLTLIPEHFELPIGHAEGRFVADQKRIDSYLGEGNVAVTYAEEVNGSLARIAGLQDKTGRVFGMMPHPDRFLFKQNHYDKDWDGDERWGWGYYFFKGIREVL